MASQSIDAKVTDEKFISIPDAQENAPELSPIDGPQPTYSQDPAEEKQAVDVDEKPSIDEADTVERAGTFSQEKEAIGPATTASRSRRKRWIWIGVAVAVIIVIALAVGLGVHFGTKSNNSTTVPATSTSSNAPAAAATSVLATPDPSNPLYGKPHEQGCLEQANANQSAICVPLPNACPDHYRSVYWDWGCPDGENPEWRCCI